jgi:hypothetical protein
MRWRVARLRRYELVLGFVLGTAFWLMVALVLQHSSLSPFIQDINANSIAALGAIVTAAFTGTLYWNAHNQLIHNQQVERAYVKLSHPPPGIEPELKTDLFRLTISVKNFGRTPARVTDVVLSLLVLPSNQSLPEQPVYTRRDGGQSQKAFLVANDEFFYFRYYQVEADE